MEKLSQARNSLKGIDVGWRNKFPPNALREADEKNPGIKDAQ